MKKEAYFELAEKELAGVLELIKRKGNDYSGGSEDVLENFKLAEKLGLAKAEIGLLLRMMDKIQRVKSFVTKGELKVANESASDAARDIIGYALALIGLMHENQEAFDKTHVTIPVEGLTIVPARSPLNSSGWIRLDTGPNFSVDDIMQEAENSKKSKTAMAQNAETRGLK